MSADREHELGALAARVPPALRGASAYHVPKPPNLVAKLDANELPYPLPAELREGLADVLAHVALERYPDPRASQLRELLARQLGGSVTPDQLTFGNGSDELIAMLLSAFAHEPAGAIYPSPSFVYYQLAAVARGVRAIEVPLRADFTLDEAAFVAAVARARPSCAFLALPNNPTGTMWRLDFARELAAAHRDLLVVSDEAYAAYSGQTNLPAVGANANLVVMRTLSKIGMAGLRVGFTVAAPAIAALLEKVRPPYNLSAIDQAAAVFLLEHAGDWCAARAADVVRDREQLARALAALGGDLEVFPSAANLLLVRDARADAGRASDLWCGLADRGISVRTFGDHGPLAGCMRITVGTPRENELLVATLRSLLAA